MAAINDIPERSVALLTSRPMLTEGRIFGICRVSTEGQKDSEPSPDSGLGKVTFATQSRKIEEFVEHLGYDLLGCAKFVGTAWRAKRLDMVHSYQLYIEQYQRDDADIHGDITHVVFATVDRGFRSTDCFHLFSKFCQKNRLHLGFAHEGIESIFSPIFTMKMDVVEKVLEIITKAELNSVQRSETSRQMWKTRKQQRTSGERYAPYPTSKRPTSALFHGSLIYRTVITSTNGPKHHVFSLLYRAASAIYVALTTPGGLAILMKEGRNMFTNFIEVNACLVFKVIYACRVLQNPLDGEPDIDQICDKVPEVQESLRRIRSFDWVSLIMPLDHPSALFMLDHLCIPHYRHYYSAKYAPRHDRFPSDFTTSGKPTAWTGNVLYTQIVKDNQNGKIGEYYMRWSPRRPRVEEIPCGMIADSAHPLPDSELPELTINQRVRLTRCDEDHDCIETGQNASAFVKKRIDVHKAAIDEDLDSWLRVILDLNPYASTPNPHLEWRRTIKRAYHQGEMDVDDDDSATSSSSPMPAPIAGSQASEALANLAGGLRAMKI